MFYLSSFGGLASCRMLVERGGKEKKKRKAIAQHGVVEEKVMFGSGTMFVSGYEWALYSWPMLQWCDRASWVAGAMVLRFWRDRRDHVLILMPEKMLWFASMFLSW